MTVAENLLLAADRVPLLIDWRAKRAELKAFLATTPFQLDLDACPSELAAGEKQKLELLKQLYLKPRLLILDEPTSVLTPQEADEVLGHVRDFARSGQCTVIIITHKFREVMAYADAVTVLRRGKAVHHGRVADTTPALLAQAMMGEAGKNTLTLEPKVPPALMYQTQAAINLDATMAASQAAQPVSIGQVAENLPFLEPKVPPALTEQSQTAINSGATTATPALQVDGLTALGDRGTLALHGVTLTVHCGEILGVAGVSGNGQRELVEALVGQRARLSGQVRVMGQPYHATRSENRALKVRSLPEEPLRSACVGQLSVAENMALRDFDQAPLSRSGILRFAAWRSRARAWIAEYGIKTQGETAPIASLSGGNVQRAVLARELAGDINVLIAANPVFGLDFAAVEEIHTRLRLASQRGAGVLLISEDLDELLELCDRIVVMSEGRVVFETSAALADRKVLGAHMGGGTHHDHPIHPEEKSAA